MDTQEANTDTLDTYKMSVEITIVAPNYSTANKVVMLIGTREVTLPTWMLACGVSVESFGLLSYKVISEAEIAASNAAMEKRIDGLLRALDKSE